MTHEARNYLAPAHETFWKWKDRGEVVAWRDGNTIAFRAELSPILRRLAPGGLPPFGAVVLLLAATRDSWREANAGPGILTEILNSCEASDIELLTDVLGGLHNISLLEPELRSGPAREVIVEQVFEGLKDRGSELAARQVVEMLDDGLGEEVLSLRGGRQPLDLGPRELLRELRDLRQGLHRVLIKSRLQTGLDEIPRAADLELTPAERVRLLLSSMKHDDELRGLATLALQLMAAVTLPRSVSERDEMPLGGISDIANRGPLDRLLLSELAHDDLTLAVRVAVNEALYLRRESPPKTPPQQRSIFLEAGIRSWGVPRVFAAAVALALAASAEKNNSVAAFRAKGKNAERVDLTTRAGLASHLAALEPELHPGSALAAFKKEIGGAENASEPVLVTTEEILADPDFQLALAREEIAPILIAAVSRAGLFRLFEKTARGTRLLREATFDLEDLFSDPKRTVPSLVDREWARDLPVILSVAPFPLLLSHRIDPKRMLNIEGKGTLALSNDRRLMLWTKSARGAKQLSDEIPKGALWPTSSHLAYDNRLRAIVGQPHAGAIHLVDINLSSEKCEFTSVAVERNLKEICSHNGGLFAVYPHKVNLLDEAAGEFRESIGFLKDVMHHRGRFFKSVSGEQWYALSFNGMNARLERVIGADDLRCPKLQTMFEMEGAEGPIGVTELGDLYFTATRQLQQVSHDLSKPRVGAISFDGKRIVLVDSIKRFKRVLLNVEQQTTHFSHVDPAEAVETSHIQFHSASLRNRFVFVFIDDQGVITLTSKKLKNVAIDYDAAADRIRLRPNNGCGMKGKKLQFQPVAVSPRVGYRLAKAAWSDGSLAYLDSRGLLHLRSSDRAVPETTIVLNDGELSGWCADGRVWGTGYFIGDRRPAPKKEVFDSAIRAFAKKAV